MLNAGGAIAMASAFDRAQPTDATLQPPRTIVTVDQAGTIEAWEWGQRVIWGDTVLFGQRIIWGDASLASLRVIWGDALRWGSPFAPGATDGIADNDFVTNPGDSEIGDGIIWADNLVWGNITFGSNIQFGDGLAWNDNLLLGENIVWGNRRQR